MPDGDYRTACAEWRSLAIVLSALDTIVIPELTQRVSWPDVWKEFRQTFNAVDALDWLGLDEAQIGSVAQGLLRSAKHIDGMGDFFDLVRRSTPDHWETLTGPSLMAHDLRVAAEVLTRASEMASDLPTTTDEVGVPMTSQRITTRGRSLEETLIWFDLSPHPSVLVIVEGATEFLILHRILTKLKIATGVDQIHVENRGGIDDPVQLLARYVARPRLGTSTKDFVLLAKPPTRVLVITDPEKDYKDEAGREAAKQKIAKAIISELPHDLHPSLMESGAELVTIFTWPDKPFEFAHFSDDELATGLLAMTNTKYPGGRRALVQEIAAQRSRPPSTKKRKGPDVETVWAKWIPGYDLSKPKFAETMWPILEAKIDNALNTGGPRPPIMDAALKAEHLSLLPRHNLALERSHPEASADKDVKSS